MELTLKEFEDHCKLLVGMKEEEARKHLVSKKFKHRTVQEDGEPFIVTSDFIADRFNLIITGGVITNVYGG